MRPSGNVDRDRLMAVVLVVLAAFAVYLLGVHWWFTARHAAIWQEMSELSDQELAFRATSAQREEIEARLAEVRAFEAGNPAFLSETDFDSAAAALSQRLRQIVTQHARNEQSCQIIMNQYAPSTEKELFQRAAIRVRLRCSLEEFQPILYDIESASPVLFVDEVQIWKQTGFQQPGSNTVSSYLDIQFTLWGYMRLRAPIDAERGA
jgi:general secretion pathway protein M